MINRISQAAIAKNGYRPRGNSAKRMIELLIEERFLGSIHLKEIIDSRLEKEIKEGLR